MSSSTTKGSCSPSGMFTYALGEGANSRVICGISGFAMLCRTPALGQSERRVLIGFTLGVALMCFARGAGHAAQATTRPNVLFIAIDDLNDWVGLPGRTSAGPDAHPGSPGGRRHAIPQCALPSSPLQCFTRQPADRLAAFHHRDLRLGTRHPRGRRDPCLRYPAAAFFSTGLLHCQFRQGVSRRLHSATLAHQRVQRLGPVARYAAAASAVEAIAYRVLKERDPRYAMASTAE